MTEAQVRLTMRDGYVRALVRGVCPACGSSLPEWGPVIADTTQAGGVVATVHATCRACGVAEDWTCRLERSPGAYWGVRAWRGGVGQELVE